MSRAALGFVLALCLTGTAQADMRVVQGEGRAVVSGKNANDARRAALSDALYDAASKLGARIRGVSIINTQGALREESTSIVEGRFNGYKILSEGREGSTFVVRVEAVGETEEESCGGKRVDIDMRQIRLRAAAGIDGRVQRAVAEGLTRSIAMLGEGTAFRVSDQRALPQLNGSERTHQSQYDYMGQLTGTLPSPAGYSLSGEIVVERARRDMMLANITDTVITIVLKLRDNYSGAQIGTIRRSMQLADKRGVFGFQDSYLTPDEVDPTPLFDGVRQDLEAQLSCRPLRAAVLQSSNGKVLLSVGLEHGINRGDYFLVTGAGSRNEWQIVQIEEATPVQSVAKLMKPKPAIPADSLATLMR